MNAKEAREKICEIGKRLSQEGLVAGHDGNISIRLSDGNIAISPSMKNKGDMHPEDIAILSSAGDQLEGKLKASSESLLHLEIYKTTKSVGAVVHAHPIYATAFACANKEIDLSFMDEAVVFPGKSPILPFYPAGSLELAKAAAGLSTSYNSCLLQKHGALSWARDLDTAFYLMQKLEQQAHIYNLYLTLSKYPKNP